MLAGCLYSALLLFYSKFNVVQRRPVIVKNCNAVKLFVSHRICVEFSHCKIKHVMKTNWEMAKTNANQWIQMQPAHTPMALKKDVWRVSYKSTTTYVRFVISSAIPSRPNNHSTIIRLLVRNACFAINVLVYSSTFVWLPRPKISC